jgi:hypothetical protein
MRSEEGIATEGQKEFLRGISREVELATSPKMLPLVIELISKRN